ncbi:hypothetical protein NOR53_1124 [gamma proteobacterium NOR5-3]|nr:hypothetical protein NOR53_1124 [gamma proteobacterium NOR5-3]
MGVTPRMAVFGLFYLFVMSREWLICNRAVNPSVFSITRCQFS